jgi:hypothetical protein
MRIVLVVSGDCPSSVNLVRASVPTAIQISTFVGRRRTAKAANTRDNRRLAI